MNPFEYTNNDYKPRRRWIAGFSHKPSPLKVLFYTLLISGILILIGQMAGRAFYLNNQGQCLTYKYPTQADKDRCKNFGVEFKLLK